MVVRLTTTTSVRPLAACKALTVVLVSVWFPKVPFDIVYTPERGRFMIATQDLKAGDPVVRSFPYCSAICDDVKEFCCQYCFKEQAAQRVALPIACKCQQVWYCSEECKEMDRVQHEIECNTMDVFFQNVHWEDPANRTEVKLLCRTLSRRALELRKVTLPPKHFYVGELIKFDDYFRLIHSRKNYSESLLASLKGIVDYVKSISPWLEDIDEEKMLDVVLKTRNNMFNIFKSSSISLGWGVYVEASLFNHSCQPNTCLFRAHGTPAFQFLAIEDVPKGGELTVTYLGYGDLNSRREHLKEHYFFHCDCVRCVEEEAGKFEGYHQWFESSHCKTESCLGYIVPLASHADPSKKNMYCNYCSFADDDPAKWPLISAPPHKKE